ncbi:hypothetical protein J2Y03_000915 [Neobacillus niacini]|nr:hypothetical protein [Neobacillus niacini]MDR7075927.1 hypothetical protein [Neobacillus niacini]
MKFFEEDALKAILAHAQLETTKIYENADTQMKREAIEKQQAV